MQTSVFIYARHGFDSTCEVGDGYQRNGITHGSSLHHSASMPTSTFTYTSCFITREISVSGAKCGTQFQHTIADMRSSSRIHSSRGRRGRMRAARVAMAGGATFGIMLRPVFRVFETTNISSKERRILRRKKTGLARLRSAANARKISPGAQGSRRGTENKSFSADLKTLRKRD